MAHPINHDPFSRTSIWTNRVYALNGKTCSWCGNCNHTKSNRPYLNEYWQIKDDHLDPTVPTNRAHLFCSFDCFKAFNN